MVAMLNENKNQNGVLECGSDGVGSQQNPMFTGCLECLAEGVTQVQNLRFKAFPVRNAECGARNIEYLPLKTTFSAGGLSEGWRKRGRERRRGRILNTLKVGHQAGRALALFELCCRGSANFRGPTRLNSPKLARTLILKVFLNVKGAAENGGVAW